MASMVRYIFGWKGPSGFGSSSTAEEVVNAFIDRAKGRVVLITGSNSGIGYETAKNFARVGAIVVLGCRSLKSAQETAVRIRQELNVSEADVHLHPLEIDISKFASIHKAVETFLSFNLISSPSVLHILINNAGIMACPQGFTPDGLELQIGTNHFGHFLLTNLLGDALKRGAKQNGWARVVNVSSIGHWMARSTGIPFEDLKGEKHYEKWHRYAVSKLANILHAMELNERFAGTGVTAYSLHPGVIGASNLMRHQGSILSYLSGSIPHSLTFTKNIPQGAATQAYCALAPNIETKEAGAGGFWADCNHEVFFRAGVASDSESAKKLWKISEELTQSTLA